VVHIGLITIDEECIVPIVNAMNSGTITVYVPEGSSVCIIGNGSVVVEYYEPEDEEGKKNEP
jgi:hypothetical protein